MCVCEAARMSYTTQAIAAVRDSDRDIMGIEVEGQQDVLCCIPLLFWRGGVEIHNNHKLNACL